MKYSKDDLALAFDLEFNDYNQYIYIWRTSYYCIQLKQMFCYTFDLDYSTNLTTDDIDKIQGWIGEYLTNDDVRELVDNAKFRVGLFLALTNSPRCPYKIIGISTYKSNPEIRNKCHFMLKDDVINAKKVINI